MDAPVPHKFFKLEIPVLEHVKAKLLQVCEHYIFDFLEYLQYVYER